MSKLFFLNGIKSPGRCNVKGLGEVNLEDLTDEQATKLYNEGCPFLVPSQEGFKLLYPEIKPIVVAEIKESKKPAGKRGRKSLK